jgi:hypothetical protein
MPRRNFEPVVADLFLASNLRSETTGIAGVVLWIFAGEFAGAELGPRIMVVVGDKISAELLRNAVTVRLTTPPEVMGEFPDAMRRQVIVFLERNRNVLLQHWDGELASREALDLLKRI